MITRRGLVLAAAAPLLTGATKKKRLGLEIYSLRAEIAEDLAGTLARAG